MKTNTTNSHNKKYKWGLIGAIASAVIASVCCLGPLVLLALGISGAWISSLSGLAPYRPVFMAITFVFLGLAFYKLYKKPKAESCELGSYCGNPKAKRISKIILWVVTVSVVILFALPYAIPYLAAGISCCPDVPAEQQTEATQDGLKIVTLDVRNMTCAACTVTVTKNLKKLEGIKNVSVSLKPPQAFIVYDPIKVDIEEMTAATANIGYPSSAIQKGDN